MLRMSSHFVHSALLWITWHICFEHLSLFKANQYQLVGEDTALFGNRKSVGIAQAGNLHCDPMS